MFLIVSGACIPPVCNRSGSVRRAAIQRRCQSTRRQVRASSPCQSASRSFARSFVARTPAVTVIFSRFSTERRRVAAMHALDCAWSGATRTAGGCVYVMPAASAAAAAAETTIADC